jgi:O-antigen/teichoic acid export membrane protein
MNRKTGISRANLSAAVLRGGRVLVGRQVAGLLLSLLGMLLLTRLIGPTAYGTYSAAFGIIFFLQTMSEYSLDVYLVRFPGELPSEVSHQVFTFLLCSGLGMTAVGVLTVQTLRHVLELAQIAPVLIALFAGVPLVNLQQVPLSLLERDLDYGTIGVVELVGQLGFFVVALFVATMHPTAWAPVFGWWAQQILLLVGYWGRAGYRFRLLWRTDLVRLMLAYGTAATTSTLMGSLRSLANPLLVGGFLGATAVGYVSLALRLLDQASFVRLVVGRISIAIVSRVIDDAQRLQRVLTLGSEIQLAAVAVPVMALSLVSGAVIPGVFGERWRPVAEIIPILAPVYLASAAFSLHLSVLSACPRPWDLALSQGTNSALLWGAGMILVPRWGIQGYAVAELIAVASWLLTGHLLSRHHARPHYAMLLLWCGSFSLGAIAPVTTWWLVLLPLVACLLPASTNEVRHLHGFLLRRT